MVPMTEATYEMRLRGSVSTRTLSIFEEMDMRTDTMISAVVTDEGALHTLLERVVELGLEILEVRQVSTERQDGRAGS
jgi:hypothetical protein